MYLSRRQQEIGRAGGLEHARCRRSVPIMETHRDANSELVEGAALLAMVVLRGAHGETRDHFMRSLLAVKQTPILRALLCAESL
jgi:hypothetical protein